MLCLITGIPKVKFDFQRATGNFLFVAEDSHFMMPAGVVGHLTLPYSVTGLPPPTRIEWFHNDLKLDASKYNASHLRLRNVELSDVGEYVLEAESMLGEAKESILLSILPTTTTPTTSTISVTPSQNGTEFSTSPDNVTLTPTTEETIIPEATSSDTSGDDTSGDEATVETPSRKPIITIPIATEPDNSPSTEKSTPSRNTGTVPCFLLKNTLIYTYPSSDNGNSLARGCGKSSDKDGSCGGKIHQTLPEKFVK